MVKNLTKARKIEDKYCTKDNVKMMDQYTIDGYYLTDDEIDAIVQELKDAGYVPYVDDVRFKDAPQCNRKVIRIEHSYWCIPAYSREVA